LAVPDHDRAVGVDAKRLAGDTSRQKAETLDTRRGDGPCLWLLRKRADRPKKIEATDTTARFNDIWPSLVEREHYHLNGG
jgi:hypothetical protein